MAPANPTTIESLATLDYSGPMQAPMAFTFVVGVALLGVGNIAMIFAMFWRARQLSEAAAFERDLRTLGEAGVLKPGRDRIVMGVVECDDPSGIAVELDVVQEVVNRRAKKSHWHEWVEKERHLVTRAFSLVTTRGDRVRVEPGENVFLVDALATEPHPTARRQRVRKSDAKNGETFFAYGDLSGGPGDSASSAYRSGAATWSLSPSRTTKRMLLASKEIGDRFGDRISFLRGGARAFLVGWLLFHGFVTIPFGAANLFGEHTHADVFETRTFITSSKGHSSKHYVLKAVASDGFFVEQEVERKAYDAIRYAQGDLNTPYPTVPMVRVGRWKSATALGTEATVHAGTLIVGVVLSIVLFFVGRMIWEMNCPWYDKRKLIEHGGSGKWTEKDTPSPNE